MIQFQKSNSRACTLIYALIHLLIFHFSDQNAYSQNNLPRLEEWAQKVEHADLPNFYKIDDQVYRSKQPDHREMKELNAMGIGTILNLRHVRSDRWKGRSTQLQLIHLPINSWKISYTELVTGTSILLKSKDPVLVHCWHGSDRTGCIIACYRLIKFGWTKQQAIDEMRNGGYGFHYKRFAYIPVLLQNLDLERFKKDVENFDVQGYLSKPHPHYIRNFILYLTDLKDWNLD